MNQAGQQENHPRALAAEFLRQHQASGNYRRELIERLASLASSASAEAAKEATGAIFASLVERLADSFEPQTVTLYNRVFAQLIQFCRQTPQGHALDAELNRFELLTESDFVTRAEQLRHIRKLHLNTEAKRRLQHAVVLSRVTIGADVAITSIVIERLKQEFPNARLTLIGNAKAAEIFGGDPRLQFAAIHYQRDGALPERLLSWLDVLRCARSGVDGLGDEEYLIVDPDSRLTQLGLLPLTETASPFLNSSSPASKAPIANNYLFFPSREMGGSSRHSLSELTSLWLNVVFGGEEKMPPCLHLKGNDIEQANALVERIRKHDARPLVAINFGVGENPMKRVSDEFEKQVINRLLREGAKIILDKGAGEAETQRADAVIEEAKQVSFHGRAIKVVEADEARIERLLQEDSIDADVLVWSGRIGFLAALIATSDLYIGYDSAGQHIASALGVPCIDVFAGYSSMRMPDRWRPTGSAETCIIAVDTLRHQANSIAILEETLDCARAMIEKSSQ